MKQISLGAKTIKDATWQSLNTGLQAYQKWSAGWGSSVVGGLLSMCEAQGSSQHHDVQPAKQKPPVTC